MKTPGVRLTYFKQFVVVSSGKSAVGLSRAAHNRVLENKIAVAYSERSLFYGQVLPVDPRL